MPDPKAQTLESGADAGAARVEDRRPRAGVRRPGTADGISITRWSLALSLTLALSVVAAAFTLVWNLADLIREREPPAPSPVPAVQ